MSAEFGVIGLGRMAYADALSLQRALAQARIERTLDRDILLLVEHPPVVTLGRGFREESLRLSREVLAQRGIGVFDIDRGGDITFHGPGQLVGYPIFDLQDHKPDLHWFLRALEGALIRALDEFGIVGERRDGYTGVWTAGRKIASIGIHVKQWVTWHGFALNVTTDLAAFDAMIPCGIPGVVMTSVQRELGERAPRDLWGRALDASIIGFSEVFGRRPQAMTLEQLDLPTGNAGVVSPP